MIQKVHDGWMSVRAAVFAAGAAFCFAVATWALVVGVDHGLHPCAECHDPMLPRDFWKWFSVVAAMYYVFALLLCVKVRSAFGRPRADS
jgi:hypothetical protein